MYGQYNSQREIMKTKITYTMLDGEVKTLVFDQDIEKSLASGPKLALIGALGPSAKVNQPWGTKGRVDDDLRHAQIDPESVRIDPYQD